MQKNTQQILSSIGKEPVRSRNKKRVNIRESSTIETYRLKSSDCKDIIKGIERGRGAIDKNEYELPDIYEQYKNLKKIITKPE